MADPAIDDRTAKQSRHKYVGEERQFDLPRMYDVASPPGITPYLQLRAPVVAVQMEEGSEAQTSVGVAKELVNALSGKLRDPERGPEQLAPYLTPLPSGSGPESQPLGLGEAGEPADAFLRLKDFLENQAAVASSILQRLMAAQQPHSVRRQLIVEAEVIRFAKEQVPQLLSVLWRFIESYRDSNDVEDLVAVGSAIRKLVALMDASEIGSVASLLETGHRATLPLETEVELTKMIARKFRANPPQSLDPEPQLAERLFGLFGAYSSPHVLPRGKHKTVAMNALLGLAGMCSPKAEEAVQRVNSLPFRWFGEHLCQELEQLVDCWRTHASAAEAASAVARLESLLQRAKLDESSSTANSS